MKLRLVPGWVCLFVAAGYLGICRGGNRGQGNGDCPWCPYHKSYYNQEEYSSLMTQVETGNQYDTCPCVKRPGTELCMTYDPRYQAATLPEAIMNFPDLTNDNEYVAYDPSNPWRSLGYGSLKCRETDATCKQCTTVMIQHLRQTGQIDNTTVNQLNTQFSITPVLYSSSAYLNCERYYFSKPGRSKGSGNNPGQNNRVLVTPPRPQGGQGNGGRRRGKRQSTESLGTVRHVISSVNKGDSEDNSELMNLCSMTWVWRQLPAIYFPTYVNELVCSATDPGCLADQGSCIQRYRNLNFLQNFGNDTTPNSWQAVTLSSGTSCECQVKRGTTIAALVTGTGKK